MKKVVCVWIGKTESEKILHDKYLKFGNKVSKFGIDASIEWYDEDFMESWWYEKLDTDTLIRDKETILDPEYFYDDMIEKLKNEDLSAYNTIHFLFGSERDNLFLFNFNNQPKNTENLKFVFRKEFSDTPEEFLQSKDSPNLWQSLKNLVFPSRKGI